MFFCPSFHVGIDRVATEFVSRLLVAGLAAALLVAILARAIPGGVFAVALLALAWLLVRSGLVRPAPTDLHTRSDELTRDSTPSALGSRPVVAIGALLLISGIIVPGALGAVLGGVGLAGLFVAGIAGTRSAPRGRSRGDVRGPKAEDSGRGSLDHVDHHAPRS